MCKCKCIYINIQTMFFFTDYVHFVDAYVHSIQNLCTDRVEALTSTQMLAGHYG